MSQNDIPQLRKTKQYNHIRLYRYIQCFEKSCHVGFNALQQRKKDSEKQPGPGRKRLSLDSWGRATHTCASKLTIIASDNGLSPGRRQAIIWNNAGILSIGLLGTNFSEILIEIHKFSLTKMRLKVSSAKWGPCCLGLNVLGSLLGTQVYLQIPMHPLSLISRQPDVKKILTKSGNHFRFRKEQKMFLSPCFSHDFDCKVDVIHHRDVTGVLWQIVGHCLSNSLFSVRCIPLTNG